MNQNLPEQKEKKMISVSLACAMLMLSVTGGLLIYRHITQKENMQTAETIPEITTESGLVETDMISAASNQTEGSQQNITGQPETVVMSAVTQEIIAEPTTAFTEITRQAEFTSTVQEMPSETPAEQTEILITELVSEPSVLQTEPETVISSQPNTSASETVLLPESASGYKNVLETIFRTQKFQGDVFYAPDVSDISENEFAVYDIDNDGTQELIIRWSNTDANSVTGVIYGQKADGSIYQKLKTTPYLRFYSNGIIEADSAHNQGLSGSFCPYTLYQYHAEQGIYTEAGAVDAWDKSVADENWYTQEAFPSYADFSNSGFVYFIYPPDYDYSTGFSTPLDVTEYESWHRFYINDATEVTLPFRKMTEENIALLS